MALKQPEERIPLEGSTRLSKSMLWKLQKKAYIDFGPAAWSSKGVPSYVTSNPFVAHSYALVVLGYIRDCLNAESVTPIDKKAPFYIFDLGAGTGRFGYLFLRYLCSFLEKLKIKGVQLRYVMTDISSDNLAFLREHPYLQPFIKEGILDLAFFHHDDNPPMKLEISGEILTSETNKNPIVVIANYLLDSIPQDLFKVENGKVFEGRISVSMKKTKETENLSPSDPAIINHLIASFDYEPIPDIHNYYPESKELFSLLERYISRLEGIPFIIPVDAVTLINYFKNLSKDRLLFLAADQGKTNEKQLKLQPEPFLSLHGSFSMGVNYHAIAQFFQDLGGETFHSPFSNPSFVVTVSLLGGKAEDFPETAFAYKHDMERFDPYDYFQFINEAEKEWATSNLDLIFLLLKFGEWDPVNFNFFFEKIRTELKRASKELQEKFVEVIDNVWLNFYPTDKSESNFVMNLGVLLYDLKRYDDALKYLQRALELDVTNAMIYHNMACCYFEKGDRANYILYSGKFTERKNAQQ